MRKTAIVIALMGMLSGCHLLVNMPALIQQTTPTYREEYVNKRIIREVCGGRVVVVNESRVLIRTFQDNYSRNAAIVRPGIPYEHIVVEGYNQYGQLLGVVEETFLCTERGMVERWVIHDWMLWNERR